MNRVRGGSYARNCDAWNTRQLSIVPPQLSPGLALVMVWGEFGRTPRMGMVSPGGAGANPGGRDHWGRAAFVLLGGGGMRGGVVVGATTRDGGEPGDRPVSPGDVLATIYQRLGIDRHRELIDRLGRAYPLLESGTPIAELL